MSQALSNYDAVQETAARVDALLAKNPTLTGIFVRRAGDKSLVAVNEFAKAIEATARAEGQNSPATTTAVLEDIVSERAQDRNGGTELASGDRAIFVSGYPFAKTFG